MTQLLYYQILCMWALWTVLKIVTFTYRLRIKEKFFSFCVFSSYYRLHFLFGLIIQVHFPTFPTNSFMISNFLFGLPCFLRSFLNLFPFFYCLFYFRVYFFFHMFSLLFPLYFLYLLFFLSICVLVSSAFFSVLLHVIPFPGYFNCFPLFILSCTLSVWFLWSLFSNLLS